MEFWIDEGRKKAKGVPSEGKDHFLKYPSVEPRLVLVFMLFSWQTKDKEAGEYC